MLSLEYSVNYDEIAVNYEEKTFFTALTVRPENTYLRGKDHYTFGLQYN